MTAREEHPPAGRRHSGRPGRRRARRRGARRCHQRPAGLHLRGAGPDPDLHLVADLDAPPTIAFGETIAANAIGTLTVPEDVTAAIRSDLAARRVDGKADVNAAVSGTSRPWTLVFPATDVPAAGPMTLVGVGTAGNYAATKVGTTYDVVAGHFTAVLNFYNAAGSPHLPGAVHVGVVLPERRSDRCRGHDRRWSRTPRRPRSRVATARPA